MNKLELELLALKELLQEQYKASLFLTAKRLCGFKDITKYTHGNIVKCLESDSKRKCVVAPRGTFKSSLGVSAFAVWRLINNPNTRILITSEVYTNSKNFIREIRSIFESKQFVDVFGDLRGDRWGEGEITIKRSKKFKEASVTAAGVGTIKVGQHYDLMLLDDLNSNKNSNSPENCKKVVDYYRYLLSILEPDGTLSITATRYSNADLVSSVLQNEVGDSAYVAGGLL